ncbi:MAG: hypothetical protein E6136_11530 [Eggerthella sp.]|nr:hypothetical protein [Eggerthella sp.]
MEWLRCVNEFELLFNEPQKPLSPVDGMELLEEVNNLRTWKDFVALCDKYGDWLCFEPLLNKKVGAFSVSEGHGIVSAEGMLKGNLVNVADTFEGLEYLDRFSSDIHGDEANAIYNSYVTCACGGAYPHRVIETRQLLKHLHLFSFVLTLSAIANGKHDGSGIAEVGERTILRLGEEPSMACPVYIALPEELAEDDMRTLFFTDEANFSQLPEAESLTERQRASEAVSGSHEVPDLSKVVRVFVFDLIPTLALSDEDRGYAVRQACGTLACFVLTRIGFGRTSLRFVNGRAVADEEATLLQMMARAARKVLLDGNAILCEVCEWPVLTHKDRGTPSKVCHVGSCKTIASTRRKARAEELASTGVPVEKAIDEIGERYRKSVEAWYRNYESTSASGALE